MVELEELTIDGDLTINQNQRNGMEMLLTLCLTHDCNLRCSYCYAGRKFKHHMNHRTAERAIELGLEESLKHATPKLTVRFFGGEPLLEWETLKWSVDHALLRCSELDVDLRLAVTTNGTLLTDSRVSWLREREFHVGLSLDGNPAMHDTLRRFRNGRSSHGHGLAALRRMHRRDDVSYEVILVPDPRSIDHLAASVTWLLREGVRNITLNPNFYVAWPDSSRTTWRKHYEDIAKLYVASYQSGEELRVNVFDGKIKTGISGGYGSCSICSFGEGEVAVAPSGNLYPCERMVGDDSTPDMCIGNVFEGFDEEKRGRLLDRRTPTNAECIDCSYRPRCMNWCCCINYATTGETDSVHGLVCFHEQLCIETADTIAETLFAEANPVFLEKFYS